MRRRVTVLIDTDLDKKLRGIQVKKIRRELSSFSYSDAINETLQKTI